MDRQALMETLQAALKHELFSLAGTPITVATALIFGLIVGGTFLISRLVQRALGTFLALRGVQDEGTVGVASRLLHYLVLAIGLGIGLQTIGVNLSALFAAGAVFAIAIGFAMQNIAQNFVSGVILLLERTIKPGDILEVDGARVKVVKMGIRATIVRSKDDEEMIVPNTNLVGATVKNFTLRDNLARLRIVVGVTYSSDMRLVIDTLTAVTSGLDWRSPQKDPEVFMSAFADSSVNFEISVWINDPWSFQKRKSDLHQAVWFALQDRGIVIAFPQLDLHLDPPVVESLAGRASA